MYKLTDDKIEQFLVESSMMGSHLIDDGPPTFYKSFGEYKTNAKSWMDELYKELGWKVIDYMIRKNAHDPGYDYELRYRALGAVSYLDSGVKSGNTHAIAKYKKRMEKNLETLGWTITAWLGLDAAQDSLIGTVLSAGVGKSVNQDDLEETFSKEWWDKELLEESMLLEEGVKFDNFLKDWSKKANQPLSKIRKTMMNKNTFSVAKLNDFSVDKVFEMAKTGFKGYQKIINYVPDKIAQKLAKTKFGQKKEKALVKLDDYLKKHPKLKRVMGIGAAAAVTYAWTKMTFIGDPEYDLDLSAAASAAALGEVSFADLFSGEMGTKFLVLTAVGAATGLTAPYVKAFGKVGTMAAGVGFGAYRAYKARKKRKADAEKKAKTSAPDTVKNPNPKGRKKTIGRQSAVRWVAKTKGNKAAIKYAKSLQETKVSEDDVVKNRETGNTYIVKKHNPKTQDKVKSSSSSKERIKTIQSWGKDPHGNLFLGDDNVGYSKEVHTAQYVTKTENSMVIGTPHTEHDKKGKQFFEKNIVPMIEKFIEDNKGEKIIFLAEGGQGDGHNYWPNSEQEAVGEIVKNYDKGEVDTWDGKYNKHDDGHEKAPIYKDLAKKMGKQYTPSDMTGAMYSNLVGQGDNGKEALGYLTDDGKQFLRDNGYTGEFPPKDKSEVQQLYDLNYPEDSGDEPGSNPVAKAQLAWNQLRRDNMDKKMKAYEDAGYKVLVVPGATHGSAIKAQSNKVEIKEHLLLEGGAAGHMNHPFDDSGLTFGDFKQIIKLGLSGKLNREDDVTEKLDGQNLLVSWKDDKLIAARNKGQLKGFGANALDVNGVASKFAGRGNIKNAFVFAMKDLQKAIKGLSAGQKDKVFGEGKRWMNLEVMYPASANVVNYDGAYLVFHNATEYNEAGMAKKTDTSLARILEGMIRQVNQHVQKKFTISKPQFLTVSKSQDFAKRQKYFLSKLQKLQNIYNLKDKDTLGKYHETYWMEYIHNASKQMKYNIPRNVLNSLTKRWAFLDKSFRLNNKVIKNEKFLDWAKSTDKKDMKRLQKDNIKPFETLFFELGAEILKNVSGFLAANPKQTVSKMKKEVDVAIKQLRSAKDVSKLDTLKRQLEKFEALGGSQAIVPSEGIVFKYKNKMYKFTGAFAPINQILGLLTFG